MVKLDGKQGMGGRNQEFALKAALELQGQKSMNDRVEMLDNRYHCVMQCYRWFRWSHRCLRWCG